MRSLLARFLFTCYLAAMAYATFSPFTFVSTREALARKVEGIKWVPFRDPRTGGLHSPRDFTVNIAVFVPFGIFGFFLLHRTRDARDALTLVVLWAAAISVLIEGLQLLTEKRVTNVTDLVANTLGGYLGGLVAVSWQRRSK